MQTDSAGDVQLLGLDFYQNCFDIDLYTGRVNYARPTFTREVHL